MDEHFWDSSSTEVMDFLKIPPQALIVVWMNQCFYSASEYDIFTSHLEFYQIK